MAQARAENKRTFRRWSDWSDPSEPVALPSLEHVYTGPVKRGTVNVWPVAGKNVEVTRDAPTAKIIASQYDLATGARVPMELEITEGSVLSAKAESADVVDPITLQVKKLPDAEIVSGTTVVDITGGTPLRIADDKDFNAPGFMLLYDQNGNLKVTDDISDQEYYRIYNYSDEKGL